jgi:hypothetical protein
MRVTSLVHFISLDIITSYPNNFHSFYLSGEETNLTLYCIISKVEMVTVKIDISIPISENMGKKFSNRKLKKKTPCKGKTSHKMSSTFHQRYLYCIGEVPKSFHFPFTSRNAYRRSKGCFRLQCQGCYRIPLRARSINLESSQGNSTRFFVNRI